MTRHIAFLSPPSDNEMPLWALPEYRWAPVQAQLVFRRQHGATLLTKIPLVPLPLPGAHAPPGWYAVYTEADREEQKEQNSHLATQTFKPMQVLLEAAVCTEGV